MERPGGGAVAFSTLIARGLEDGATLVVVGGVHGDEFEGPQAILEVYESLAVEELRGTLIGIPVVNVPAFEAGTRTSPIDGLNLARVFPGQPHGSVSQRIAYGLLEYVVRHADLFVDLHSAGVHYRVPTFAGYYCDLSGELGRISREAAFAFGVPIVWGSPLNEGRSISEAVRHYQVPSIYAEATGGGTVRTADVAAYVRGVRNVMKYLQMLPGEPVGDPVTHFFETEDPHYDFDTALNVRESGFLIVETELLAEVRPGDRLARVVNLCGETVEEVCADRAGHVLGVRAFPRVFGGELAFLIV